MAYKFRGKTQVQGSVVKGEGTSGQVKTFLVKGLCSFMFLLYAAVISEIEVEHRSYHDELRTFKLRQHLHPAVFCEHLYMNAETDTKYGCQFSVVLFFLILSFILSEL